jgi:surface antigen
MKTNAKLVIVIFGIAASLTIVAGCASQSTELSDSGTQAPQKEVVVAPQPPSPQEIDWQAADKTGTVAAYSDFLQKYPQTTHLRTDTTTFAIANFARVSNSSTVSAGPNGEIVPGNFQTVLTCEVMKNGQSTGETITFDEAEKRGFLVRDPPHTGRATGVNKKVQSKLYKRADDGSWTFVSNLEDRWEPDH